MKILYLQAYDYESFAFDVTFFLLSNAQLDDLKLNFKLFIEHIIRNLWRSCGWFIVHRTIIRTKSEEKCHWICLPSNIFVYLIFVCRNQGKSETQSIEFEYIRSNWIAKEEFIARWKRCSHSAANTSARSGSMECYQWFVYWKWIRFNWLKFAIFHVHMKDDQSYLKYIFLVFHRIYLQRYFIRLLVDIIYNNANINLVNHLVCMHLNGPLDVLGDYHEQCFLLAV